MSYGITPIAVRLAEVRRAFGSRDAVLASAIREEFAYRFEQDRCDEDDEDEPSLDEALYEIIEGKPQRGHYGHKYAYALEMICLHLGERLPDRCLSAMRGEWADAVERALAGSGVPRDVFSLLDHLMYRGAPVAIPVPGDFPFIGYLKSEEVGAALGAVESADVSTLDPELREAVAEVRGWLEACAASACDLVCFYY